jgi:hypothetical protein
MALPLLDMVTVSVDARVQQGSFTCRLPVASFTSFWCYKPCAVHALTVCVRDFHLQRCMGHKRASLFKTCLLSSEDVPVYLLQLSVNNIRT